MKTAFVEVSYRDDGPAFASSSGSGAVDRAEVYEIPADSISEAESLALARIKKHPMAGGIRVRFLRWENSRPQQTPPIQNDHPMVAFFKDETNTLDRREQMSQEMITDFMIDLETFGTGHNAVIVGIGLAGFNLETGVITPMLDLTVDPTSCMEAGLKADGDTILWWMRQSDAARAKINTNRMPLQEALFEVIDRMRGEGVKLDKDGNSDARVWGNGIRADNVWLASAFAACGMPAPWSHRNDRDVRTIRDLAVSLGCEDFKKTLEFSGTPHCALDDAVHQVKYVCSYFDWLQKITRLGQDFLDHAE